MIDSRVRRLPALSRVAPGYVVVCAPGGTCVEMGGSAAVIWQALPGPDDAPIAFDELVEQLADVHEVDRQVAARDVAAALHAWETAGCATRRA